MHSNRDADQRLDDLFRSYRSSFPDPDVDPLWTPRLWEKIEAQRSFTFSVRRWTRTLVTAAAAICALMAIMIYTPQEPSMIASATYVEVLSEEQAPEMLALADFAPPIGDVSGQ
jgi:hypothetical protein